MPASMPSFSPLKGLAIPPGPASLAHPCSAIDPHSTAASRPHLLQRFTVHSLMPSRRQFLALTAATVASAAIPRVARAHPAQPASSPLRLLILGGTKMLGPAIIDSALARNHHVTIFNRRRTELDTGVHIPDAVERLTGNRDPRIAPGLAALEGRTWDAVIDTSGLYPRHVATSAALLNRLGVAHYIFISSISAYASHAIPNSDESDPLADPENPYEEDGDPGFGYTGELKAPCERAVQRIYADRATIIRPAYLVGPGDATGRFAYWPLRTREGADHPDILVPGHAGTPIQVLDIRDLAQWLMLVVEQRLTGTFNACGPAKPHTIADVLAAGAKSASTNPRPHWVTWDFLREQRQPMPIVLPDTGRWAGFHTRKSDKAVAAGLTFRPLHDTADAILRWFDSQPATRHAALRGQPTLAREAELLAAWNAR